MNGWLDGEEADGGLGSVKVTAAFVKGDGCWSLKADAYKARRRILSSHMKGWVRCEVGNWHMVIGKLHDHPRPKSGMKMICFYCT